MAALILCSTIATTDSTSGISSEQSTLLKSCAVTCKDSTGCQNNNPLRALTDVQRLKTGTLKG